MSTINELVGKLRQYVCLYGNPPYGREIEGTRELLREAAGTIEELSAKVDGAPDSRMICTAGST